MASSIARCVARGSCSPVMSPSTTWTPRSGVITRLVEPSDDRRPDGDDAPALATGDVHGISRIAADAEALGVGHLSRLEAGDAGVEHDPGEANAGRLQPCHEL